MVVDNMGSQCTMELHSSSNAPAVRPPHEVAGSTDHGVGYPVRFVSVERVGVEKCPCPEIFDEDTAVFPATIQMVDWHLVFRRIPHN